jgi:hypothetical protein
MLKDAIVVFVESESAGLIVLAQTNVLYQVQTGGYACIQERAEGFYVPLSHEVVDHYVELHRFFTQSPQRSEGIDESAARFVDSELGRYPGHAGILVDRERLNMSREAWIHVRIVEPTLGLLFSGCTSSCAAVLVWPNSD